MSNPGRSRLESLNRKPAGGSEKAKPALKFKPKVVARRSDKDLAADAPKAVQRPRLEDSKHGRGFRGGRGGSRGSRGGRGSQYDGKTEIISSGLFSSPSTISRLGNDSGSSMPTKVPSKSPTPEYFNSLRRETRSRSATENPESDDESYSRIDLNNDLDVGADHDIASLFPVRPLQFSKLLKKAAIDDDGVEDLNDEHLDDELLQDSKEIMQLMNAYSKMMVDPELKMEDSDQQKKIKDDILSATVKRKNEQFMLLQLPSVFPKLNADSERPQGQIGTIQVRKSGKLVIKFGDIAMDLVTSPATGFLQDVVAFQQPKEKSSSSETETDMEVDDLNNSASLYQLGQIGHKVVALPRFVDHDSDSDE